MYLALLVIPNSNQYGGVNIYQAAGTKELATLEEAKKAAELFISNQKAGGNMGTGYEVYVIDRSKATIAASASLPMPSLDWK